MHTLDPLLPSYLQLLRHAYGMSKEDPPSDTRDKEEEESGMIYQAISHWHYFTQDSSGPEPKSPSAVRVILARERVLGLLECLGLFLGKGMKGRRDPERLSLVYHTLYPILLASTPWCWDWEEVIVDEEGGSGGMEEDKAHPSRRIKWEYAKGYEIMLAELTLWIYQSLFLSMEMEQEEKEEEEDGGMREGMKVSIILDPLTFGHVLFFPLPSKDSPLSSLPSSLLLVDP